MKKGKKSSDPLFIKSNRSLNPMVLNFNIPILIDKLKLEKRLENEGLVAKILLNNHYKQIVLTLLHESTEIDSFQGSDSATYYIIEGELEFYTRKESIVLKKGQELWINENIEYHLVNKMETVFVLTLINSTLELCRN